MKEQSPIGRIWELGAQEHGRLITAVALAVIGVACGMVPYFAAAKIIVLLLAGEQAFTAYLPWLLTVLAGFLIRTLLYNSALSLSHKATFQMDGQGYATDVKLEGVYNLYNAAAALAVVRAVMQDNAAASKATAAANACAVSADELIAAVSRVTPAFGRGEVIDVNGSPVELLLVKNPMGFRLSLASFDPANADTMIAINDEYADGRDMSWLWDVDFTSLRASGVAMVSGVRAWDMALRLGYDQVPVADTNTDLEQAVTAFVNANPGTRKHIYCTYTAMLKTRAVLGRITEVRDAGVGK